MLAVDDGSDASPATGEADYEDALAGRRPSGRDFGPRASDDPYVIYTGGTTGHAQGRRVAPGGRVLRLHRRRRPDAPARARSSEPGEVLDRIIDGTFVFLPVAPLMHAAAPVDVASWLFAGGTVVLLPGSLDADASLADRSSARR